jgi:hypothetical protein
MQLPHGVRLLPLRRCAAIISAVPDRRATKPPAPVIAMKNTARPNRLALFTGNEAMAAAFAAGGFRRGNREPAGSRWRATCKARARIA